MIGNVYFFDEDWYKLSDKELKDAKTFAQKRKLTDGKRMVATRNVSEEKFSGDTLNSAWGEIVATKVLTKEFGLDKSAKPDFEIYKSSTKKAEKASTDLTYGKLHIHVITCSIKSASKYTESYVRQTNIGKLFTSEVQNSPYHFLFLILVNEENKSVCPRALVSWKWVSDNDLMKDLVLKDKHSNKKALYYSSLEGLNVTV